MLYDPKRSNISKIARESGVKFEHLSAPQPVDVAKAAGMEAAESITQISNRYICWLLLSIYYSTSSDIILFIPFNSSKNTA